MASSYRTRGFGVRAPKKGTHFAASVAEWVEKAKDNAMGVARQTIQTAAERVIERTPVDTGNARAHWQPRIKTVNLGGQMNVFSIGNMDATGANPQAALAAVIAQMQAGDVFVMTNNVVYIRRLEYGWSQQAAHGMVRITLAELPQIAQEYIQQLGGQK